MHNIIKGMFRMYSIIPVQVIGFYAIYLLFSGQAPNWWWITFIVGYICIMMLGICAGYHRLFSHRGYQTSPLMKKLILWFATLSGQGSPIFWCAIHRGYHHRYTDKEGDPHRPEDGFWHSYILWMFKIKNGDHNTKYIVDLLRDKDILFFHKHYNLIFCISHILIATISFDLWVWLVILPSFVTSHSFSLQTSLNHAKTYGYRNYATKDNSVNVLWLFPLILGEAWHNNHHGDAKNANYGSKRWWELDPTYWLIKLIKTKD